ncbi:MAG: hypothetical protein HQ501_04630 [Rhodospirillales bacterium]|nr:hypothetical protein [Rhodospirillales bacterium]
MPVFEVALYNRKVRDLVEQGEHHPELNDEWADTHYIEVRAPSEEAARAKMEVSRPRANGYVIDNITEVD